MSKPLCGALWACWAAYWLWAARGASRAKWSQPRAQRLVHRLGLAAGFLLIFTSSRGGGLRLPAAAPFVGATAAGLAFAVWARRHLGRHWSSEVTLKEGHAVVETGPYRLVRHPIYTGILAASWASAAGTGATLPLAGAAVITATVVWKLGLEERALAGEFGPAYESYRARTKALVPFLL